MNGNNFVNFLLHTPLRGLLGDTMLITVTGRKTGRHYSTPVGFFEEGGYLWVVSSRDRTWWRNLRGGAPVGLYLRGREVEGTAEVVQDEAVVKERLDAYVQAMPMAARGFGVQFENGKLCPEDAVRLARERLFVRIKVGGR